MAELKKYWKGIEEKENAPQFQEASQKEFSEYVPVDDFLTKTEESNSGTNRRDFLKVLGFSVTAATLAACEAPVTKSIPFLNKPIDATPGVANYYASTYFDGLDFSSIKVKTREGRPIFIEANGVSPLTSGVNARINSSVLSLYDAKRAKGPAKKVGTAWAKNLSWTETDSAISKELRSVAKKGGKVVLLSNTVISPAAKGAVDKFSAYLGAAGAKFEHVSYDAISASGLLDANKKSFGKRVLPTYAFEKAKTIVSFGADFLGSWLDTMTYTKAYSTQRRPDGDWMSRHYQFETAVSVTGSAADVRGTIKPSEVSEAVKYLFGKLGGSTNGKVSKSVAAKLNKAAADLKSNAGDSLVVSGSNNEGVQVLVNAINDKLGNYGNTIDLDKEVYLRKGSDTAFKNLASQMNAGKVDALIVVGLNPAFVAPSELKFNEGLAKVDTVVYTGDRIDETGSAAHYLAPSSHYLESWDVLNPKKGQYAFVQPTINPLFKTRQWQESLLTWSGDSTSYEDFVKSTSMLFLQSKKNWVSALHDGFYSSNTVVASSHDEAEGDAAEGLNEEVVTAGLSSALISKAAKNASVKASGAYELDLYVKTGIGNGEQAFNPWLHELPDPITKMTYDNYIAMNPSDVLALFKKEDSKANRRDFLYIGQDSPAKVATVTVNGQSLTLPVVPQPGQATGAISIAVGYGRKGTEVFTREEWLGDLFDSKNNENNTIGKNAFPLASSTNVGVEIKAEEALYPMATTQTHHTMMGRKLVNETTLTDFIDQKGKAKAKGGYNEQLLIADSYGREKKPADLDLWAEHAIELHHRWGLNIDLNSCIGCGSCVTACHLENNVSVVGKDEVRRSREMHWMRVDRYYSATVNEEKVTEAKQLGSITEYLDAEVSDSNDNVSVVYQPVMCQHCNHAPCETVCPVAATTHSDEGLNQMAYNRCVGTRYCANNCPYKVRRFNWFQYDSLNIPAFPDFNKLNPAADDLGRMVLNPDVVVRSRGVMEKCSMCVQKIQAGKLEAKKAGEPVQDGAIQSACSSSCPTNAISFGDLNDETHYVNKESKQERAYMLLEEVGAQPNVYYQTKIRNTND